MVIDVGADDSLDLYARILRRVIDTPVTLVSLVEPTRQRFPGAVGLPTPWQEQRETPLTHSFCQYVVRDEAPLVVADARAVPELLDNLAIPDLGVVAYAGWPLTDHLGRVVGSLCAIDTEPREWTTEELSLLEDVAAACSAHLSQRSLASATLTDLEESEQYAERSRLLLALSEALSRTRSLTEIASAVSRVTSTALGCERAGIWLSSDLSDPDPHHAGGLTRVADPAHEWRSADRFTVFAVDDTSPIGLAALSAEAEFLPDRATQDATYPHLVNPDQIGEARAFVPLVMAERMLGVLVMTWPTAREFGPDDRVTIAALASYTAQAVQRAALLEERVAVSVTLQRAMLTDLPAVPGLELAARYLPAGRRDQVGGDWYDAVALPDGRVMLVVGDVIGHDIVAAAVMGQLRSMLRAIVCTHREGPAASLIRLDQLLHDVGVSTLASVFVALVERDPAGWTMTWSSAGHLPALVVGAGGSGAVRVDHGTANGLIGIDPGTERDDHRVVLDPGSQLVLYTDGLVERRGESLDVGLERLGTALLAHQGPLSTVLDSVLTDQLSGDDPDDDVAILAVRFGVSTPVDDPAATVAAVDVQRVAADLTGSAAGA